MGADVTGVLVGASSSGHVCVCWWARAQHAGPRTILARVYVLGRGGRVCEGSVYAQQLLGVRSCGGRLCELGYA